MIREPLLHQVPIKDLRPTQITVGMREVSAKRKAWKSKGPDKEAAFLGSHLVPVINGPDGHAYVVDHHHLTRALLDEGQDKVAVTVIADLSRVHPDSFWFVMDNRNWMHPYDDHGRRQDTAALPTSMKDLIDDPYRSLAGELRLAGGYAKDTTPFSEFLWADFFRRRISRADIEESFDQVLKDTLSLARSEDANYLPGWCGPIPR